MPQHHFNQSPLLTFICFKSSCTQAGIIAVSHTYTHTHTHIKHTHSLSHAHLVVGVCCKRGFGGGEGREAEIAFIHLPPVLVLGSTHSSEQNTSSSETKFVIFLLLLINKTFFFFEKPTDIFLSSTKLRLFQELNYNYKIELRLQDWTTTISRIARRWRQTINNFVWSGTTTGRPSSPCSTASWKRSLWWMSPWVPRVSSSGPTGSSSRHARLTSR